MVEDIPLEEEARAGDDRAEQAGQGATFGREDLEAEEVVHDSAAEPDFLGGELAGAGETEMSLMGLGAAQEAASGGKRATSVKTDAAKGREQEVNLPSSEEADTEKGDMSLVDPDASLEDSPKRVQSKPRKQGPAKAQVKKRGKPKVATGRPQKKRGKPKKVAGKAQATKLVQQEGPPQYGLVDEAGDGSADT